MDEKDEKPVIKDIEEIETNMDEGITKAPNEEVEKDLVFDKTDEEAEIDLVSDKTDEEAEIDLVSDKTDEEAEIDLVSDKTDEEVKDSNNKIKKYLEKPLSRKYKKLHLSSEKNYEKQYMKKQFQEKEKKTFKFRIMLGLLLTIALILLFRYILEIDMTVFLEKLLIPSLIFSGILIVLSLYLILSDKSAAISESDPITDFFIITKGKITGKTKKNLENRINTRFIMITLLKLFQKEQITIVDERFVLGTNDTKVTKDEVAILDFLLNNDIETVDDFINILESEKPVKQLGVLSKADSFYERYKKSVIEMAHDKKYINRSINTSKFILRVGGLAYSIIVIALISTGQWTLESLGIYALQATVLFVMANFIFARSKGAHIRISGLRKQKKMLQSPKDNIYTSLIYNYLFGKEEKILNKINKYHKNGTMESSEYAKFSETYNGFNYIIDHIKNDNK